MKKLMVVLVLMVVAAGCNNWGDSPDLDRRFEGQIRDVVTGKGFGGVRAIMEKHDYSAVWYAQIIKLDSCITDDEGYFQLDYWLVDPVEEHFTSLRIEGTPPSHQNSVLINGAVYNCMVSSGTFFKPDDGQFYFLELVPMTFVVTEKPSIPPGSEIDSLRLVLRNVSSTYSCLPQRNEYYFRMDNEVEWAKIEQVRYLDSGNNLEVEYQIRNGIVKKMGSHSFQCGYGDTTHVVLPLFD